MDARSTLKNTKRNVWAAALLMVFGLAWITPQAFAQILPPLPLPGGSLIVTITSPAPGSPVSGTVQVNASVSIVGSLTVSQVQFFRDGNFIGSDSAAPYSVSWNTTGTNNGSHALTAVATDILGVRWNSNPVNVTVSNGPPPDTTPPSVPTGLTANAVSSSQINLSWTASSDNVGVSGYRVYRGGTQIATTSATSFTNTGVSASTTYSYTVAAYDAAGNVSAQSSPASATTPAPPDTTPPSVPTGLTANAVSSSQINLSWTASSDNVGVSGYRVYRGGTQIATTSATSFTNTGVSASTTYSYTVAAYDAAGNVSAQSSPASATTPAPPDTTPPSVPTGLTANAVSSSQINLSWTASSDNVGVSGYRVYRGGTQIATTSATSFTNTGVSASTTYSYTVAAYDAAGNVSAQSSPASATTPAPPDTTPPSVPTGLTANAVSSSQINLSWTASSDNVGVSGYRVYRGGTQIATTSATSFTNTGVSASTTYSYTVAAYDAAGNLSAQSSSAIATTPAPPDTTPPTVPTGLSANAVSSSQINLSWTASSDNVGVSGYRVYRGGTQIGTPSTTSFTDTSVSASTTYSYTVAAYDAAGNVSAQSSSASATTPAPPDTPPPSVPTGLTANAVSSSQINLSWTASSDNVGVSGYRVYRGGIQIATPGTTSFTDTGVSPSTTYSYTVAAYDAAGNLSAQSSPASATTPAPPDTTPPSVPTGLTASAVSSSQINLSWAASSDNVGVTGYRVFRNGTQTATTGATFFTSNGLSPSTTYTYAVAAFDAAGNLSAQSSPASATTPAAADTTPPSVPTGLTASAVSSSQINLSWAASSGDVGVSGYRVF